MQKKTLMYIATVITMFYGVGFVVAEGHYDSYAVIGAVVVAAAWMAYGMLGREDSKEPRA